MTAVELRKKCKQNKMKKNLILPKKELIETCLTMCQCA